MTKYYAISEHGTNRDRFEITNKQTGRYKKTSNETILNETSDTEAKYNKLELLRLEIIDGKAVVEKIGLFKTSNFTINDCDTGCVEQLFSKTIRNYEKKKTILSDTFEYPFLLEFAYPRVGTRKKLYRKLSFDEMVKCPINPID